MKQSQEIKSFFYGQYFAEGLRITIGSILPVIVCAFLDQLLIGTIISFGALVIGLSDTPGAPSHRRTGMLACLGLCAATFIITILSNTSFPLMCILLGVLSFVYSMFGVFNARASTVGAMGILTMLLLIDAEYSLREELLFLLFFVLGGIWYLIISLLFTRMRPYRQAQQELSESIRHVADFLRLKANFYKVKTDYDQNYIKVIEKQVEVHKHQENVRELLFNSKRSIKDTTKVGRFLTLIFNDIVDLFEQIMTTQYDYAMIRKMYSEAGVLHHFKYILVKLAQELDHLAYQLNANRMPLPLHDFTKDINNLRSKVDQVEKEHGLNVMPLRRIIVNVRKMVTLIDNIYNYSMVKSTSVKKEEIDDAGKFIQTTHIDWKNFRSNLSLESSFFRHALRVAIVMTLTFIVLHFLEFSHKGSFWVLLSIFVILKPGFGVTKERNVQRVMGTVIGGVIGGIILFTVHNEIVLFALVILFFLIAYSLFRINYIMFVVFLTPYVLIMLSFSGVNTLEMAKDRILDTFLGGMIAFLSSYIIFPNWESSKLKENINKILVANFNYLEQIAKTLLNQPINITEYKLTRKELYIASSNMGSTFQRMLTEPKWRQRSTKEINRFVILNHMFSSHSGSLFTEVDKTDDSVMLSSEQYNLLKKTANNLYRIFHALEEYDNPPDWSTSLTEPPSKEDDSSEYSRLITEQLQFLLKISSDLQKATEDIVKKEAIDYPKETTWSHG